MTARRTLIAALSATLIVGVARPGLTNGVGEVPERLTIGVQCSQSEPNPFEANFSPLTPTTRVFDDDQVWCRVAVGRHAARHAPCVDPAAVARSLSLAVLKGLEPPEPSTTSTAEHPCWEGVAAAIATRSEPVTVVVGTPALLSRGYVLEVDVALRGLRQLPPGRHRILAFVEPSGLGDCLVPDQRVTGVYSDTVALVTGEPVGQKEQLWKLYREATAAMEASDWERARAAARRLLDVHPLSCLGWGLLGDALKASGDAPGAREAYSRAIAIAESDADALDALFQHWPGARQRRLAEWRAALASLGPSEGPAPSSGP